MLDLFLCKCIVPAEIYFSGVPFTINLIDLTLSFTPVQSLISLFENYPC